MAKEDYYKVKFDHNERSIATTNQQELFRKIDLEDDGIIYLKEIVIYLRIMNEDIDDNLKVNEFVLEMVEK